MGMLGGPTLAPGAAQIPWNRGMDTMDIMDIMEWPLQLFFQLPAGNICRNPG